MPNPYFKFKKFTVYHDKCAMKVGTDGVLLGAWVDVSHAKQIVDVGTGSGLIALMLAQRNPCAEILGIDIDAKAVLQASENFESSPFKGRLSVQHLSFDKWVKAANEKVDAIISNPPFFQNSLQSPDASRTLARHSDSLSLESLFRESKKRLTDNGSLSLILPYDQKNNALQVADENKWSLSRITTVFPTPNADPKRVLMDFSLQFKSYSQENQLIIEESRHVYTADFVLLAKDFYLKM